MTVPAAKAVEQVAVAIAASVGLIWQKIDGDQAFRFRTMANAALVRSRDINHKIADQVVDGTVADAIDDLRKAARQLQDLLDRLPAATVAQHGSAIAPLVDELYKRAASLEAVEKVVESEEVEEAV